MLLHIIFAILILSVSFTLFYYNQKGGLHTIINADEYKGMNKKEIVKKLRELIIYKNHYTRWNKFLIISLFFSYLVCYYFKSVSVQNILIVALLIFIAIDSPQRWINAHVSMNISHQASVLYGMYIEKINKIKKIKKLKKIKKSKNVTNSKS